MKKGRFLKGNIKVFPPLGGWKRPCDWKPADSMVGGKLREEYQEVVQRNWSGGRRIENQLKSQYSPESRKEEGHVPDLTSQDLVP